MEVEPIERYGEAPVILPFKSEEKELEHIGLSIKKFEKSAFNSLGIICKTQEQADKLYQHLRGKFRINLLNAVSVAFGSGIVITTAHLAKGLEFDAVIVPYFTDKNYRTDPDRQMLYVECTRAMHQLQITYTKKITPFLN